MHRATVIASLLPLALAATNCPDGAHIIAARGSDEDPGYGSLAPINSALIKSSPGADSTALDWPASFEDYFNSEDQGTQLMRSEILDFVSKCPKSPLVLMGYSQGAQVVGDALAGQAEPGFSATGSAAEPVAQSVANQVACVLLFGDPSETQAEKSFLAGNSTNEGLFPRTNSANFGKLGLTSRMQSYCDNGDKYCAGGTINATHHVYFTKYGTKAVDFCAEKIKAWKPSGGGSAGSPSTGNATVTSKPASAKPTTGASSPAASAPSTAASSTPSSSSVSTGAAAPGASWDLRACGLVAGAIVAGFFSLM